MAFVRFGLLSGRENLNPQCRHSLYSTPRLTNSSAWRSDWQIAHGRALSGMGVTRQDSLATGGGFYSVIPDLGLTRRCGRRASFSGGLDLGRSRYLRRRVESG